MKTIRQIADEIGVSKQAVYKRYKGKLHTVCAPYAHTVQGVLYLSEQAETLIKQDFLQNDCSNGAHTERSIGAVSEQSQEAGVVAGSSSRPRPLPGSLTRWPPPSRQRQRPRPFTQGLSSSSLLTGRPERISRSRNKSVGGLVSCFEVKTA